MVHIVRVLVDKGASKNHRYFELVVTSDAWV
jgi:hypothetical protein